MSETVTVDKRIVLDIIMEIEDRIEELELLISPEIIKEAKKRDQEIAEGTFIPETEIIQFLEKKGINPDR